MSDTDTRPGGGDERVLIFVGGLPFGMDEDELARWLVARHALAPTHALVMRKRNGWSKGHAAVRMPSGAAAEAAARALDGTVGPNPTKPLVSRVWTGAEAMAELRAVDGTRPPLARPASPERPHALSAEERSAAADAYDAALDAAAGEPSPSLTRASALGAGIVGSAIASV
jgi:hypothetical protein